MDVKDFCFPSEGFFVTLRTHPLDSSVVEGSRRKIGPLEPTRKITIIEEEGRRGPTPGETSFPF